MVGAVFDIEGWSECLFGSHVMISLYTRVPLSFFLVFAVIMLAPAEAKGVSDLERTWEQAHVAAPPEEGNKSQYFRMSSKEAKAFFGGYRKGKTPIVLFMHGCTGFKSEDRKVIKKIASAGYFVVAPDSMARDFRPLQCSSRAKQGGNHPYVFDFRQAELNYALDQLWRQSWVDWDNMFLVGVSEGGLAVAHYRGDYFRGRVITQWTCHGSPIVQGLSVPLKTPVLAIVRRNDPWYDDEGSEQSGDCGAFFGDRAGSKSIVLEDGKKHDVMKVDAMMEEIIQFLNRNQAPL